MAETTIQELYRMLDAADRAGNREDAEFIAAEIGKWQSEQDRMRREYEREQGFQQLLTEQAEEMSPIDAALVGAGKTFTDWGRSVKGGYLSLTGQDEEYEALQQRQADEARLYAPLAETHRGATLVGEMLPYLATAPLGGGAGAAAGAARGTAGAGRALGMYAGEQAAIGAGLGALGAPVGENLTGAGLGGAISGAMPLVGRGLGNVGRRGMEQARRARELTARGVPLTPGQRLGSNVLETLEQVAERMPGVGPAFQGIRAGQQRAINRIAAESIGETTERLTGDVLENAARRIGQGMDEVVEATGRINFNRNFVTVARSMRRTIANQDLDAPVAKKMVNRLLGRMKQGAALPAREYQNLNTRIMRKLKGIVDPDEREMLGQLKNALDDMVEEAMPPSRLARWQELRGQWRNLSTLEKVTDAGTGNVSGRKLYNALGGAGRRRGQGRSALQADTPLAEAARLGSELAPRLPNSGTPTGMLPWLAAGGAMASDDYSDVGLGLGAALAAPWAYRGAGRLLATPAQAGVSRGLQGAGLLASQPAAARLGAGLTPGLLE